MSASTNSYQPIAPGAIPQVLAENSLLRNPKKKLRPVSPKKNGTSTVGKLSFLHSDTIDEHFDEIHACHSELASTLHNLEVCTKSIQKDLTLVLSSKNVTQDDSVDNTEGRMAETTTATKSDIQEIMSILLRLEGCAGSAHEVNETVESIAKRLETVALSSQIKPTDVESSPVSFNAGTSIQHTYDTILSRIDSLHKLSVSLLEGRDEDLQTDVAYMKQMLSAQTRAISILEKRIVDELKDSEMIKENAELTDKHTRLEKSYSELEEKYNRLEAQYDAKLRLFMDLEYRFGVLHEASQKLRDSITECDLSKYDKIQTIHSKKVRELRVTTPLLHNTRVYSMPVQSESSASRDIALNNSDIEE